jgi:predicted phage terminase large subunit-like protein
MMEDLGLPDSPISTPQGTEISSDDLERVRNRAKNDLYVFAKGILGYRDLTPRTHQSGARFLLEHPSQKKMLLAPRGHFKTSIFTISDSIRELAIDPNIRILIANESGGNSQAMLTEIKNHFTMNARLRAFFGYIIPRRLSETTWTKDSILIPRTAIHREPSITAVGVETAVVSRHFNLFKFDDLVGEEAFNSPAVMEKTIQWLRHSVSLVVNPMTDRFHIIGTRWSFSDVYSYALKDMGFELHRISPLVRLADGTIEPRFKERFTMRWFQDIIETDPQHWSTQYANDPLDIAISDFKKEWIRWYEIAPDGDIRYKDSFGQLTIQPLNKLTIFTHVDPSMGEGSKSDYSAVVTVGVNSQGQVFVLEAWRQRVDPINLVEKIFQVHESFNPKSISIEAVAFQKALKPFIEREASRRRTYLRIVDYKPSNRKSKAARIRGALQPYFASGHMFLRSSQADLVHEYLHFGREDHEDLMDALAQGPDFWRSPKDDEALVRHEKIVQELTSSRGLTGYGI